MKKDALTGPKSVSNFDPGKKKFEHPSGWEPPFYLLHDDVKETIGKINTETNVLLRQLPDTQEGSIYLREKSNLSTDEKASLKSLKENDEIII